MVALSRFSALWNIFKSGMTATLDTLPTLKLPPLDHVTDKVAALEDIVGVVDDRYMDSCRYLPGWYSGIEEEEDDRSDFMEVESVSDKEGDEDEE